MSDSTREEQVLAAVESLVDSLLDDFDVAELLAQLAERCAQLLDIASAGLLLADPQNQLHLMAATSRRTRELELFQLQNDEGPCLDCHATGRMVTVANLNEETERWPQFVAAALGSGFVSVHAVPMRAAGMTIGALGLFGIRPGELNSADLAVGQTLAHVATVALMQEHPLSPQSVLPRLHRAIVGQVVIEQAKGLLRSRLNLEIADAFDALRAYTATHDVHLSELARQLMFDRAARPALIEGIALLAADPTRVRTEGG